MTNQSEHTNKEKLEQPTIEWLIEQIAPNEGNSPMVKFNKERLLALIKSRESALLSRAKELVGKTKGVKELYPDVDTNKRDDKLWEAIFKKDGYNQAITEVRTKLDQLSKEIE